MESEADSIRRQGIVSKPWVLFLCTHNSARSQMAEGLLRHKAADSFEVCSAGTSPVGLHPLAVAVMGEVGIDISSHRSKPVEEVSNRRFDIVITVCDQAREECPYLPACAERLHWSVRDPAAVRGRDEAQLEAFRSARNELARRIDLFLSIPTSPFRS